VPVRQYPSGIFHVAILALLREELNFKGA